MKLLEYLHIETNMIPIRIEEYNKYITELSDTYKNIFYKFPISEDMLEHENIIDLFKEHRNKVLCLCSGDIDFPPPKKPYRYDKYFNESELPKEYKTIAYNEKINLDILKILEENNLYVVSQDVSVHHSRVIPMPIGIFPKWNFNNVYYLKSMDKTLLCYANFGIPWVEQWFGRPRLSVYEMIKENPAIFIENTCNNERRPTQDLNNFYRKIASSKFAICPRGLGIDTYRLWDCLYLGCIPIVEKYDGHKDWEDLPIYFVDSLDFYKTITEEHLLEVYDRMSKQEFNYEKLNMSYWKDRIFKLGALVQP